MKYRVIWIPSVLTLFSLKTHDKYNSYDVKYRWQLSRNTRSSAHDNNLARTVVVLNGLNVYILEAIVYRKPQIVPILIKSLLLTIDRLYVRHYKCNVFNKFYMCVVILK